LPQIADKWRILWQLRRKAVPLQPSVDLVFSCRVPTVSFVSFRFTDNRRAAFSASL
jgi:hypothetical protein